MLKIRAKVNAWKRARRREQRRRKLSERWYRAQCKAQGFVP